jgi:hypothetical protein
MEMEDRVISWNSQIEKLIAEEGEKAFGYFWLHNKSELKYQRHENYISLPVIILSTVTGFLSASTGSILPQDTTTTGILGAVSIIVGILNTIGSKFAFSKRAEGHRIASIHYGKLFRFINIELSLPRKERIPPHDMLKIIREDIDRLKETAPAVTPDIISLFNERFEEETGIAKPETTNGLSKIQIYMPSESLTATPKLQHVEVKTPSGIKIGVEL